MPYEKRKKDLEKVKSKSITSIPTKDKTPMQRLGKSKIAGYGKVGQDKIGFYKTKEAGEKSDKVAFRTADGKVHATMDAYRAHKKTLDKK